MRQFFVAFLYPCRYWRAHSIHCRLHTRQKRQIGKGLSKQPSAIQKARAAEANSEHEILDNRNCDNLEDFLELSTFFQTAMYQVLISVGIKTGMQCDVTSLLDMSCNPEPCRQLAPLTKLASTFQACYGTDIEDFHPGASPGTSAYIPRRI